MRLHFAIVTMLTIALNGSALAQSFTCKATGTLKSSYRISPGKIDSYNARISGQNIIWIAQGQKGKLTPNGNIYFGGQHIGKTLCNLARLRRVIGQ